MVGLSCISPARSKVKLGAVAALDRSDLGGAGDRDRTGMASLEDRAAIKGSGLC